MVSDPQIKPLLCPSGVLLLDIIKGQARREAHGMLQPDVRIRVHIQVFPYRRVLVIDGHIPGNQNVALRHGISHFYLRDSAPHNDSHDRPVIIRDKLAPLFRSCLLCADRGIILLDLDQQLCPGQSRRCPCDLRKCPADLLLQRTDVQPALLHAHRHLLFSQEGVKHIVRNPVVARCLNIPDKQGRYHPERNRQHQPADKRLPPEQLGQKKR